MEFLLFAILLVFVLLAYERLARRIQRNEQDTHHLIQTQVRLLQIQLQGKPSHRVTPKHKPKEEFPKFLSP